MSDLAELLKPFGWSPDQQEACLRGLTAPRPLAVRLRRAPEATGKSAAGERLPDRAEPLPVLSDPVPWHPRGYLWVGDRLPGQFLEFAAGEYFVQDAASLLAVRLLDARPGENVCDLCASPGGKSTALLEELADGDAGNGNASNGNASNGDASNRNSGGGWLLAHETLHDRLPPLSLNLARHGGTRFVLSRGDPERLSVHLAGFFDAMLVDAPCSGQSLVGRGKQSLSAFSASAIEHCAARQKRILEAAAPLVKSGGRLVYATCTFAPEENEQMIAWFLDAHPGWSLDPEESLAPWESPLMSGCYRLWPHRDVCGGAFAARLVCEDPGELPPSERSDRADSSGLRLTEAPDWFSEWGRLEAGQWRRNHWQYFAWPEPVPAPLNAVAWGGPEVAFQVGSTWNPAYALARRGDPNWAPAATLDLDDSQAWAYVRGEALRVAAEPEWTRNWAVARWAGRPLGWVKVSRSGTDWLIAKNHLPKPARITKAGRTQARS